MAVKDYIRQRFFPHLWCSGCGHGIVLNGLIRAVETLGISRNEMVMVSGIGSMVSVMKVTVVVAEVALSAFWSATARVMEGV